MTASTYSFRMLGTGLVCGGLLVYQILSARLLSLVLDPSLIMFAISFAMLGMGAATSLMSLRAERKIERPGASLSWLALALGLSYIAVFALVVHLNDRFNILLDQVAREHGSWMLFETIRVTFFSKMAVVGSLFFVPYFLFGIFIARLFAEARAAEFHHLYAADLVGAATGCILAVLALDLSGYAACVAVILAATFTGGAMFGIGRAGRAMVLNTLAAAGVLAGLAVPGVYALMEPNPSLTTLARNYDGAWEISSDWHAWNAHTRVALVTSTDRQSGGSWQGYSLENGNGWAAMPNFDQPDASPAAKLVPLVVAFQPKTVLVLFAGAGTDMLTLDKALGGGAEITGVEINRQMVEHAVTTGDPRLGAFLARPNLKLEIAEAREFLERDPKRYDAILLSWSGAGASHYVGTSGFLSEYLYTAEAFETLMDHLAPGGVIVVSNGSKAKMLVTLNQTFASREMGAAAGHVALVRTRAKDASVVGMLDEIEEMRLVLKPSGLDAADMWALGAAAEALDSNIVLGPDGPMPGYRLYGELAAGEGLSQASADDLQRRGIELVATTDDRPFFKHFVPRELYFDLSRWFSGERAPGLAWWITRGFIQFTVLLCLVSAVLIMGPLLLRAGPKRSRENAVNLVYFAVLGAGFIAIEVGMVRKLGLIMGHPSYAISIVLAALILSTGLGSLASSRLAARGFGEKAVAVSIAAYVVAFTLVHPWFAPAIIGLPLPVKACITVLVLFPAGFLMGQFFPRGLARAAHHDAHAVPWAWAINGTTSTIGSALAFLYSFPLGFDAILFAGAAIYCVILVLPLARPDESPASDGAAAAA